MNKVRLFALAASFGMFASTVSAAAVTSKPKDTSKLINTVVFSNVDEIIKAEFGGLVIPQSITVSSFNEERTTKLPANYSLLGGTCFETFSSNVGKDNNLDGMVDSPIVSIGAVGFGDDKTNDFWFYDNAKTFPTAETFSYYVGQAEDGIGGRLMAPKQVAKNGFYMIDAVKDKDGNRINYHTFYEYNDAGIDAAIKTLIISNKITEVYANDELIGYKLTPKTVDANKDDIIDSASFIQITVDDVDASSRTKLLDVKSAVLDLLAGNREYTAQLDKQIKKQTVNYHNYGIEGVEKYVATYTLPDASFLTKPGNDVVIGTGSVIVMDGNGLITNAYKDLSEVTGSDYEDYYSKNRITVLRQTSRHGIEEIDSFSPVKLGNEAKYDLVYSVENENFAPKFDVISETAISLDSAAEMNAFIKQGNGLYRINTPANPSDKYVFMFDLGVKFYPILDHVYASQTKNTIDFETPRGEEITVNGVKLDNKMYPAFASKEEATDFMVAMADFGIVTEVNRLKSFAGKREWANGDYTENYNPKNGLDGASAKQCTFAGAKTAIDSSKVVVTTDASKVDTSTHGVHTLTYTATIDGETVGTTTQKVVIAPKYERKWKNGKVVELKAYHLNGNLYVLYDYNYAKGEVTATYYKHDGQTVDQTVTSKLN